MRRFLIAILLLGIVGGCAGSAEVRAVNALAISCETYNVALESATDLLKRKVISVESGVRIQKVNGMVVKACGKDSTIDPAEGVRTVNASISLLNQVMRGK